MIHIGCAAGFGGDRTDAAAPIIDHLIARREPGVLIFETLAERTLALAHQERLLDPSKGYAPLLESLIAPVLQRCLQCRIPIVSNFGAANPRAAAQRIRELAPQARIAVVEGDDFSTPAGLAFVRAHLEPRHPPLSLLSANVYLGAGQIAAALTAGAQIVVTGRVADPALVLGPAWAHYGWSEDAWDTLARASVAGHLLECGAQVTGGYFADPPAKEVPDLHRIGFPIAEIAEDGSFVISKPPNTGGVVDSRTVTEQLLYEIHDPAAYITPDVIVDISDARLVSVSPNCVAVEGIRGHPRPDQLKALAWFSAGWLAEAEISYAGPNAESRAHLAADILQRRIGDQLRVRFDLIGVRSVFHGGELRTAPLTNATDVHLRAAASHPNKDHAGLLSREVTALYTCGPAGGGGIRTNLTQRLASAACLLPRDTVRPTYSFIE